MQGLMMMLDFLEKAIKDKYLPCFFWTGINLLRKSTPEELHAMLRTVGLIRRHSTRLLAHEMSGLYGILEGSLRLHLSAGPLSEDQLRARLTANLVTFAVKVGINADIRRSFPGPDYIIRDLLRSSAKEELILYKQWMGPSRMHVILLEALRVAPSEIAARCRLTSSGDGLFSWDAEPLVALLTPSDLERVVGDSAAVSAWLRKQHRLAPEQRPTGLPPDLSSPRARTDLLLNPPLLAKALKESVPITWRGMVQPVQESPHFGDAQEDEFPSFTSVKRRCEDEIKALESSCTLYPWTDMPMDRQTVLQVVREVRHHLADPNTEDEYNRIRRRLPDSWRLRQYMFTCSY